MERASLSGESYSIEFCPQPDGTMLAKVIGPLPPQGVGNAGVVLEATGKDQAEAKAAAMRKLREKLAVRSKGPSGTQGPGEKEEPRAGSKRFDVLSDRSLLGEVCYGSIRGFSEMESDDLEEARVFCYNQTARLGRLRTVERTTRKVVLEVAPPDELTCPFCGGALRRSDGLSGLSTDANGVFVTCQHCARRVALEWIPRPPGSPKAFRVK